MQKINLKSKLFFLAILLCVLFSLGVKANAATYYVAKTGSDSNNGSSGSPWLTIQKFANVANPGDTVVVNAGTYNERVMVTRSGTAGNSISFSTNGTVIMKGFSVDASYINMEGFEITNTVAGDWKNSNGIYVLGSYCNINDNYIHDVSLVGIYLRGYPVRDSASTVGCVVSNNRIVRATRSAINIEGQDNVIESNDISHSMKNDQTDADAIVFFGTGHLIKGNNIHDMLISDPGNALAHMDCFQTWGPAYDIIFEKNYCDNSNDNMQGFMIEEQFSPVYGLTIRYNQIKTFRPVNSYDCENIYILNNTFIGSLNYSGASGYAIELKDSPSAKVQNNIFQDMGRNIYPYFVADAASSPSLIVGNNCIYQTNLTTPAGSASSGDLWMVNPLFVSSTDFHLQSTSPAINAGADVGLTTDFDNNPIVGAPDIGAYEYVSNEDTTPPSAPSGLSVE